MCLFKQPKLEFKAKVMLSEKFSLIGLSLACYFLPSLRKAVKYNKSSRCAEGEHTRGELGWWNRAGQEKSQGSSWLSHTIHLSRLKPPVASGMVHPKAR